MSRARRERAARLLLAATLWLATSPGGIVHALTASRCAAVAKDRARLVPTANVASTTAAGNPVRITFVGHATFRIESPAGAVVVTDYSGPAGPGRPPDVATMNHAHITHYTPLPDPRIPHVLRGWGDAAGPARHDLVLGDVRVRNVPTDIRAPEGLVEKDGNSIFIFELAGLCIGHLGHLHHTLGADHLAEIGQLDVVMVPVDGAFTMAQSSMIEVLDLLKARIVLPMHYFGPTTLRAFLLRLGQSFEVAFDDDATIEVSATTLPERRTVIVVPELHPRFLE
jgi:L-ascorbate metabolism protein UlaG (beta-lactamase superfamily)